MKKIALITVLLCLAGYTPAQIITTIAGTDSAGYNGDNIFATDAWLNKPHFVCVDGLGNILFIDQNNNRVRKINASGIITTIAGTGIGGYNGDNIPATNANIGSPYGIAVDIIGNIYISDSGQRIRKVNTAGIITTIAGTGIQGFSGDGGSATDAQLSRPAGIAVAITGEIYFADLLNGRVRMINTGGIITTIAGGGSSISESVPATNAQLAWPYGIALDAGGNVFFTEQIAGKVRKVNTLGIISTVVGLGFNGHSPIGDGGMATGASLLGPTAITFDGIGNFYICDAGSHKRLRKVTTDGIINTIAGTGISGFSGDGGLAISAKISGPMGIAVDNAYNVYFSDGGNDRIRRISSTVSLAEVDKASSGIIIYPNPFGNRFTVNISSELEELATVTITDVAGRVVKETKAATNRPSEIQISAPPGVYLLTAKTSARSICGRLVVYDLY